MSGGRKISRMPCGSMEEICLIDSPIMPVCSHVQPRPTLTRNKVGVQGTHEYIDLILRMITARVNPKNRNKRASAQRLTNPSIIVIFLSLNIYQQLMLQKLLEKLSAYKPGTNTSATKEKLIEKKRRQFSYEQQFNQQNIDWTVDEYEQQDITILNFLLLLLAKMEKNKKTKEKPKKENIFDNLFNMAYEPVIVDKKIVPGVKKCFTTIFNALNNVEEHIMIKINPGIYNERLEIKKKDLKIQAADISQNSILINQEHPNIVVNLPEPTDKVFFQSLKMVNVCENNNRHEIVNGSFQAIKKQDYMNFKTNSGMNTCIYIKRGVVQLDECKISLAAYHNRQAALPCIVVEKDGCLILNRSEIRGSGGTVGIFSAGGTVIMKESIIRDHGIVGILYSSKNKLSSLTIKNCAFIKNNEAIVLNGPFQSLVENNNIVESTQTGIVVQNGHRGKIANNQIKDCVTGIEIKNSSASILKNNISNNQYFGVHLKSSRGLLCKPMLKFNTINENTEGGVLVEGSLNFACIWNNEFSFNNKYGIKVINRACPHIFMNKINKTLGNAVHVNESCSAFVQKNELVGSLNCNLLLQGPNNINNFVFRNTISRARGQGVCCIFSQKFTIKDNDISDNYNGLLSLTGVQNIEDNTFSTNERNGILLIGDNNVSIVGNEIENNKKAGIFIRDSSVGRVEENMFSKNKTQIVIENDDPCFSKLEENNMFQEEYDIRIPKNYKCQLI